MGKKKKAIEIPFSYTIEDPDIPPGLYNIGINVNTSELCMILTSQKVLDDEVAIILSPLIENLVRSVLVKWNKSLSCVECGKKL